MRKPIAALLAVLPCAAFAGPVYVEYEGVVTKVDQCGCENSGYSIGDTIKGVVTIDVDRAPGDQNANPAAGLYGIDGPDFLSGFGPPLTRDTPYGKDAITVYDHWSGLGDYWQVSDFFQPEHGRGALYLVAQSDTLNIVHGDSMLQNLDLTPKPGLELSGSLHHIWGSAGHHVIVLFDLLKLKQRPGSCQAT